MDLERFKAILQNRDFQARFRIDIYTDDVPAMLRECYIDEVTRRRVAFVEDPVTTDHINRAAKWLTGEHKTGLMLSGTVGNGKTTLMKAIRSLIGILYGGHSYSERKGVVLVSALELADMARDNPERFRNIKNSELLAIDDVGVEPALVKTWGNEISPFVDLIYHRYDRQLFTLVTSNLNPEDLEKRYGARIADRFTEMFDRIAFENKTYRK